jgi:hypothetical protein
MVKALEQDSAQLDMLALILTHWHLNRIVKHDEA